MTETDRPGPISGIVAMIHVADVQRSANFYRLLGFEIGNSVPRTGEMHWAWLYAPSAPDWRRGPNLMLTRSGRPLNPEAQDVLFYLTPRTSQGCGRRCSMPASPRVRSVIPTTCPRVSSA